MFNRILQVANQPPCNTYNFCFSCVITESTYRKRNFFVEWKKFFNSTSSSTELASAFLSMLCCILQMFQFMQIENLWWDLFSSAESFPNDEDDLNVSGGVEEFSVFTSRKLIKRSTRVWIWQTTLVERRQNGLKRYLRLYDVNRKWKFTLYQEIVPDLWDLCCVNLHMRQNVKFEIKNGNSMKYQISIHCLTAWVRQLFTRKFNE